MASDGTHTFQLHHLIEQNKALEKSELLQALVRHGYDIHSPRNTIYLPREEWLANELGITHHRGAPLDSYSDVVLSQIRKLEGTSTGVVVIHGDINDPKTRAAATKLIDRVHHIEDTLKVAILNGDLFTNPPPGASLQPINAANVRMGREFAEYGKRHAAQLETVAALAIEEAKWSPAVQSEKAVIATVQTVNEPGRKPAGGDAAKGHAELRKAINDALTGERLQLSGDTVENLRAVYARHDAAALTLGERTQARIPIPGHTSARAVTGATIGGLSLAAALPEAAEAGERVALSWARDNPLAAQSQLNHYAGKGLGGALGGAAAGLAVGWGTGPGAIAFVGLGALSGSEVGDKLATWWDNRKIYNQTDRDGVAWTFNGRQWVNERPADLSRGASAGPVDTTFSALPETARYLNFKATNAATELALGETQKPRDPFTQPQAPGDAPSLSPAAWTRDAQTGAWSRDVVTAYVGVGQQQTVRHAATPERAAELERAAEQTIAGNIATGPAPIAARYEIVSRLQGFDPFNATPPAVRTAAAEGILQASDGALYRRDSAGQWLSEGQGEPARGNVALELERTHSVLQPQRAQHEAYVAALPAWQPPTAAELDRQMVAGVYRQHGIEPAPARMEATMLAIERTRIANGLPPGATSIQLEPNAEGRYDVNSPISHIYGYADRVPRIAAETTPAEIDRALADLRAPTAPVPEPPELRIAALSPQQREVHEQAMREANRLGLSNDQAQAVALQAAVAVAASAEREPEIVLNFTEAELAPSAGPSPAIDVARDPKPAPTIPAPAERLDSAPAAPPATTAEHAAPARGHDTKPSQVIPFPTAALGTGPGRDDRDDRANEPASAFELSQFRPADQAMFAKLRAGAPADLADETVAKLMLEAKRNGIHDAESIGPVGVANGRLWVGAHTPGFHTGVSTTDPAPSMQDTWRETQAFNQQRDQHLAHEREQAQHRQQEHAHAQRMAQ